MKGEERKRAWRYGSEKALKHEENAQLPNVTVYAIVEDGEIGLEIGFQRIHLVGMLLGRLYELAISKEDSIYRLVVRSNRDSLS